MPTSIKTIFLALALASFVGCGAAPTEEPEAQGGAAGQAATGDAGGAAGAVTPSGTGGAAGGHLGSAGGAVGTGGSAATGGAQGTGGAVGTGGSAGAGGAAVVEPPLCGPVGQFSTCIQRNPNKSGLKGGRWCALCDGRSVTQCTFVTPDKFDRDVACVTECTECDAWL